ncbi:MAG: prepilin-type N-terminal cleavage/methylation domain-containing protein [Candidatus Sumerlaeia bacterium]|nr:prepilin-type N-terminal cleavage/methylation domain-containing protein [Candidatus Sumerlaeia bacterium]
MTKRAFTLIELLIVVAIIAILAAIAVPNFLEAQTRSKVSRVRSDLRTMDTGLKSYYVDFNRYPYDKAYSNTMGIPAARQLRDWGVSSLFMLTTPIAFLSSVNFKDPFVVSNSASAIPAGWPAPPAGELPYYNLGYGPSIVPTGGASGNWGDLVGNANPNTPNAGFVLLSYGPDGLYLAAEWISAGPDALVGANSLGLTRRIDQIYDATNGTISSGDIVRLDVPGVQMSF